MALHICSKCKQTLGAEMFSKSKKQPNGLNSYCKPCMASYYQENKTRIEARKRKYAEENADRLSAAKKAWKAANSDKQRESERRWYEDNTDLAKQRAAEWKKRNPDKVSANSKKRYEAMPEYFYSAVHARRAAAKQATPTWSDKEVVDEFYRAVRAMNKQFGAGVFSVDHVVPLKSSVVCGLHSHTNLQVLLRKDNIAKNNRSWPDMP